SIRCKMPQLSFVLASFAYRLIVLTETWLTDSDTDAYLIGGSPDPVIISTFSSSLLEACVIDIHFNFSTSLPYRKLRIFAVYRSPSSPPSAFTSFLDFITPLMTSQFPCILIGDFNYPQVDWISMTSSTISDLIDFACDHYLKQFVCFPTRLQNFLDLVFCNFDIISNISPSVPLSDHLSLVFDLRIPSPPLHSPTPSRLYKYADWLSINSVILSHDWTVAMSALDANCAYEYYVQFINDLLDYYVPLSKPSLLSRYPRNLKILYGKCKNLVRNAPNSLACLRMTDRFNAALNNYHCFMECRIVASSNPKAFYNLCSDRLKAPKATPSGLVDSSGNVLITNDEKCIAFSSFFSSAFSVPQHSPLPLPSPKFTFDIPTVSHLDILCALRSVLPKINVSPDRIPSIVLTKCKYSLLTPLSIIFNKSLLTSQLYRVQLLHGTLYLNPQYSYTLNHFVTLSAPNPLLSSPSLLLKHGLIYDLYPSLAHS
ncbi:hypothetical protein PMAYCL1PPCAC_26486, partial [Pristionchus mayeri]